jgi:hypothetical protein
MNVKISANSGSSVEIAGLPNKCPFCHNAISPIELYGSVRGIQIDVMFKCPDQKCKRSFIGYYKKTNPSGNSYAFLGKTSQGNLEEKYFNDTVTTISPDFVKIYNEAFQAEQQDLLEICGVGYRKALEFLIKDYLIHNFPDDRETIERKSLYKCIMEYVVDASVKKVASRAVWIGNDETHYVRIWEGKNLEDMKKLIDLTVHWIEMETLTKSFEEEMPG